MSLDYVLTLLGVPPVFHGQVHAQQDELESVRIFGHVMWIHFDRGVNLYVSRHQDSSLAFCFCERSVVIRQQIVKHILTRYIQWFFGPDGCLVCGYKGNKVILRRRSLLHFLFKWRMNRARKRQLLQRQLSTDLATLLWEYI